MNLTCEYCGGVFYNKKIDNCPNCGAPLKILSKREALIKNEKENCIEIKPSTGENKIIIPETKEGYTIAVPRCEKESIFAPKFTLRDVQKALLITALIIKLISLIQFT